MSPLPPEEHAEWLDQHIKSRAFAALANPDLVRSWLEQTPADQTELRRELTFILQSSWEGRHAALRWLIEFVGNCDYQGTNYVGPTPNTRGREHSFRITALPDGIPIPHSPELAVIYFALTKATAHPTRNSKHAPIPSEKLTRAAKLVIQHLRNTVYTEAGKTL